MAAKHIPLGDPAHDAERIAILHLVGNLPGSYTIWTNAWLTDRNGTIHELDAVVAAPHAVYIVEIKSYRGHVEGNENDWYLDDGPIRSPLRLNRLTAQKLKDALRRDDFNAAQVWVEGLVFLSHATSFSPLGTAAIGRVFLRNGICAELQNPDSVQQRNGRRVTGTVEPHVLAALTRVFQSERGRRPPQRKIREYRLETAIDRTDRYVEHLAVHELTRERRVLRVYNVVAGASDEERARSEVRYRWEAQVLARVSSHPYVQQADPPFADEAGFCLPFHHFVGITLGSWVERHKDKLTGRVGLLARVELWQHIASAIVHAHRQGVVHRMLRPEIVFVQDRAGDPDLRVGGFALAKQLHSSQTLAVSTLTDERLRWAAPEVVDSFSSAEPASDQFGLGLLLGWILAGRPLFDSTQALRQRRGSVARLREINPFVPQSLDDAVHRMLSLRAADRYPTLDEAIAAVRDAVQVGSVASAARTDRIDPENIPAGTRLGVDYEVQDRLGEGGLATVYAATHLVSGTVRALKVSRADDAAEEALRGEYKTLRTVDHPNIVKVVDLSKVVPDRLTMVMERVQGSTLSRWLLTAGEPGALTLRRYAEDLFGALGYLEEKNLTHKDIKPDNLIVGDEGLTLIDFSLVQHAPDSTVGTALYRDPTVLAWDHAADRYAAALCLFELFTGRHAFDGHAPEPEREADLDDVEPAGLITFFRRALSPRREARHPSALAMRHAFLEALGQRSEAGIAPESDGIARFGAALPLGTTSMPGSTVALLRRVGIVTQGELVAAGESKIRALPGIGKKKRREILAVLDAVKKGGVGGATTTVRVALWPTLVGDENPTHSLGLPSALLDTLLRSGFLKVGAVAQATREELTELAGVGAQKVITVAEALQTFETRRSDDTRPASFRELWAKLSGMLEGRQPEIVAHLLGIDLKVHTRPETERALGLGQTEISRQFGKALIKLRTDPWLDDLLQVIDRTLDTRGGILLESEAVVALRDVLPASEESELGALLRLLVELAGARFVALKRPIANPNAPQPGLAEDLVLRPHFTGPLIEGFLRTVLDASRWHYPEQPPQDAEAVRRSIRVVFPDYQDFDPIALAQRVTDCVRQTGEGMLYQHPIDPEQVVWYVTRFVRKPLAVEELWRRAEETFVDDEGKPSFARIPPNELARLFAEKINDCRLEGDEVIDPPSRSVERVAHERDTLPAEFRIAHRSPDEIVVGLLRAARKSRGFRMIVAPPERHAEVARSVAQALGEDARFVSFEHGLLAGMEPEFAVYERAERFKAQRSRLTRAAEGLFEALLAEHGRPGTCTVLGDMGILGLCDAAHMIRRLYDETQTGARGFWVVVVPGVIFQRQPLFNEKQPLFHVDGTVLPVDGELGRVGDLRV